MSSTLEKIRGAFVARQRSDAQSYRDLLAAYVDGREVDPDQAQKILQAAGREPEDLEADAQAVLARREKIAAAAELPRVEASLKRLEAQLEAENAKLTRARDKHRDACIQLEAERASLNGLKSPAEAAKNWLQANLPPAIREQVDALVAEKLKMRAPWENAQLWCDETKSANARLLARIKTELRDAPDCDKFRDHRKSTEKYLSRAEVEQLRDHYEWEIAPHRAKLQEIQRRTRDIDAALERLYLEALTSDGL